MGWLAGGAENLIEAWEAAGKETVHKVLSRALIVGIKSLQFRWVPNAIALAVFLTATSSMLP